jgi:hypothetical protein
VRQRDPEGPLHLSDGTDELNSAAPGRRCAGLYLQAELLGKTHHQRDRGRIGCVLGVESGTTETLLAADMCRGQRLFAPHDD